MKILNVEQIKKVEEKTINDLGIESLVLMERAGLESFYFLKNTLLNPTKNVKKILIVVGIGNNGGDGLVLARMLFLDNYKVEIVFIGEDKKRSVENTKQFKTIKKLDITFHNYKKEKFKEIIQRNDLIIDSIFGIGLKRNIEGDYFSLINEINNSDLPIVALDIPSGIDADAGKTLNIAVRADYTITYAFIKIGLLMDQALDYIGELKCVDIGIPKIYAQDIKTEYTEKTLINKIYPDSRKKNSFKNKYGRILLIGGSEGMSGAITLSARAALKSGVGLAHILTEKDCYSIVAGQIPTAMTSFHKNKITKEIRNLIASSDSIVFGPGMNINNEFYFELLNYILSNFEKNLIIDAGGLSILAKNLHLLEKYKSKIILTPHPGELAKLMSLQSKDIQLDRIKATESFLNNYKNIILVLKGAKTIIADKNSIFINSTGNPILARGGSGDILSGIIGGLASQNITHINSAILGNYIHGLAGDIALIDNSENSIIIEELIEYISKAFKLIEKDIEKMF